MTLHALISYIKYRLKAKTRHGIHSPFVYKFIDECLRVPGDKDLLQRVHEYFKDYSIVTLEGSPENILSSFNNIPSSSQTIFAITGIHQTKEHSEAWSEIAADKRVKLSIDIYAVGLLFFRDEFKVKQHFVLKYPL